MNGYDPAVGRGVRAWIKAHPAEAVALFERKAGRADGANAQTEPSTLDADLMPWARAMLAEVVATVERRDPALAAELAALERITALVAAEASPLDHLEAAFRMAGRAASIVRNEGRCRGARNLAMGQALNYVRLALRLLGHAAGLASKPVASIGEELHEHVAAVLLEPAATA